MNSVQAHLDDFTSWDRRNNGTVAARVHKDVKACQLARINPRSTAISTYLMMIGNTYHRRVQYIENDLEPAIEQLIAHEKMRKEELAKLKAADGNADAAADEKNNGDETELDQSNGKKRDREDDEIQRAAKKRKQNANEGLEALVDGLESLRRLINEKTQTADIEIRQEFHKLGGKILELMAAEI